MWLLLVCTNAEGLPLLLNWGYSNSRMYKPLASAQLVCLPAMCLHRCLCIRCNVWTCEELSASRAALHWPLQVAQLTAWWLLTAHSQGSSRQPLPCCRCLLGA